MVPFQFIQPSDLTEALALLREPDTLALAGGTDLLGELKRRTKRPRCLVGLKGLGGMDKVGFAGGEGEAGGEVLKIGALAPLRRIEDVPGIKERFPILAQAVSQAATPQLRNMGTVGGNLLQRPRCWYYRSALFPCWLKGGEKCFALNGENKYHAILGRKRCQSVHPSDLAPALMALGARVKISAAGGERIVPLEDLYAQPREDRRQATNLVPGELVTEIEVPGPAKGSRGIFLKAAERKAWAFALVSVAVHFHLSGKRVDNPRLVMGGVATTPWRAVEAEQILQGKELAAGLADRAAEAAVAAARPLRDNAYKVEMARTLVQQALLSLQSGRSAPF